MERITKAAIRSGPITYRVEPPGRHHDCIWIMRARGICVGVIAVSEEGFWTNQDRFVDRKEGWKIAVAANQIIRECGGPRDTLFSEHLWRGQLENPVQNWLAKNADKIEATDPNIDAEDQERATDMRNPEMWEAMSDEPITAKDYAAYNGMESIFFGGLPKDKSASDVAFIHAYALDIEKYDSRFVYEVYEMQDGEYFLGENVGD